MLTVKLNSKNKKQKTLTGIKCKIKTHLADKAQRINGIKKQGFWEVCPSFKEDANLNLIQISH